VSVLVTSVPWFADARHSRSRTPLSSDLRDFPRQITRITPSVRTAEAALLSRSSSPSRSFCLRVSGAVAPSAFAFGYGRQVGPLQRQTSPARDHVYRRSPAPPGGSERRVVS